MILCDLFEDNAYVQKFEEDKLLTKEQLDQIEHKLRNLFASDNIIFRFSAHFLEQVNLKRNKEPITEQEILLMFTKLHARYIAHLKKLNIKRVEMVVKDQETDLNAPLVYEFDRNARKMLFYVKTIMRKKNFFSQESDVVLVV